ncbi:MAG: signal peptidase II [Endomicrobiales bacterium]|nr:signal peptidase II [Endomicrobiales bacterium]
MQKKHLNYILLIILADQITKYLVRTNLFLGQSIPITPFFRLTYITNTGIAFGLFRGANIFFIVLAIVILTVFYFWIKKNKDVLSDWMKISFALIFAGAIGNLIDRIVRGSVIDFLDFHIRQYSWPAFNVADSCITIGGVILFFSVLKLKKLG